MLVPQEANGAKVAVGVEYKKDANAALNAVIDATTLATATWEAGKQTTYHLAINIDNLMPTIVGDDDGPWEFNYTGGPQLFIVSQAGKYKLRACGAQGGTVKGHATATGGMGAVTEGTITLQVGQKVYVYVGETAGTADYASPTSIYDAKYNGGGAGGGKSSDNNLFNGAGGGATDFRLVGGGAWNNAISLNSRILVAAGGGGAAYYFPGVVYTYQGGMGGGWTGTDGAGYSTRIFGRGGTQTGGGEGNSRGIFGAGAASSGGGGGGGYYGGGAGVSLCSGGGGSSFVSGTTGCVAIRTTDVSNDQRNQDSSLNKTALNYNTSLFGDSPTWKNGDEIIFTSASTTDGSRSGNGLARIFYIGQ